MILDLDVGNTRVKWRGGGVSKGELRSAAWQKIVESEYECLDRIRVANVAGSQVADEINSWAWNNWKIVPEFAVTSAEAKRVTCAYSNPAALGVDRWLAMIAAYNVYPRNIIVVNAGSAVTVDLVEKGGQHRGGYIVPGLDMQRRALYSGTSNVKVEGGGSSLAPGVDTESAVRNGSLLSTVALVERCVGDMGGNSLAIVAGGDAERIVSNLAVPAVTKPELVLDGLAVLLP